MYCCEHCGLVLDRDLNAAINIKQFALAQGRAGRAPIQACGSCNGGDKAKESSALALSSYHGMKQEPPFRECA
jgi:transposase